MLEKFKLKKAQFVTNIIYNIANIIYNVNMYEYILSIIKEEYQEFIF